MRKTKRTNPKGNNTHKDNFWIKFLNYIYGRESKYESKDKIEKRQADANVMAARWTMILGLFTIGLAGIGIGTALILHDQEIRQLRAYVGLNLQGKGVQVEAGKQIVFDYDFINFGQTAAQNVNLFIETNEKDFPVVNVEELKNIHHFKDWKKLESHNLGTMFGGEKSISSNARLASQKNLNKFGFKEIISGKKVVYFLGVVTYDDIFGFQRETGFAYYLRLSHHFWTPIEGENYTK